MKRMIKLNSYYIFPGTIAFVLFFFVKKSIITFDVTKIDTLIGVIVTLIGALLAVLTIYLSFPKNDEIVKRMKQTRHNDIFLKNIFCGVCLQMIALVIWIFSSYDTLVFILLTASLSNVVICGYYLYSLSKL